MKTTAIKSAGKSKLTPAEAQVPKKIADQIDALDRHPEMILVPGSIKAAMAEATGKSRDLWQVAPSKLQVVPDLNPRVETPAYLAHIRDLANSMKLHGFYQDKPLAGFVNREDGKETIFIVEGGSRLKAALLAIKEGAPFTEVPVTVDQKGKSMEDYLVQMVRGNTAMPLKLIEQGFIAKHLTKFQWTVEKIAEQLGVTTTQVDTMLALVALEHRIRNLVAMDVVSSTLALQVVKKHGAKAYDHLVEAKAAANSAGKERITSRFIGNTAFTKAAKKAAEPMFNALKSVQEDPGFVSLTAENQELLQSVLADLIAAQKAPEGATDAAASDAPAAKTKTAGKGKAGKVVAIKQAA